MPDVSVKRGDTVPCRLNLDTATDFVLTGGSAEGFAQPKHGGVSVSLPAEVAGPTAVDLQTESLAIGLYKLEIKVTRAGEIKTVPDDGYLLLEVLERLS